LLLLAVKVIGDRGGREVSLSVAGATSTVVIVWVKKIVMRQCFDALVHFSSFSVHTNIV